MAKRVTRVTHEWFTALNDAYTAGRGDIAVGERVLRERYLAEGWTHVTIDRPGWGHAGRDHGYRRVYASRPIDRADRLREQTLREATERKRDAYGRDGDLCVGVDLGRYGEKTTIVTAERGDDGSITVLDVQERK